MCIAWSLLIIWSLGNALAVVAQPQQPPVRGAAETDQQGTYIPRSVTLERRFFDSTEWVFYHSLKELPPDLRELLFRVAGSSVVGPGESFNTGDVRSYRSNAQHLYTAVTADLVVIVWYAGGFSGPVAHALLYDRMERDACRYRFPSNLGVMSLEPTLKGLIRDKQVPGSKCEHMAPDAF